MTSPIHNGLKIHLFGNIEVCWNDKSDDKPIPLDVPQTRLLAYMILHINSDLKAAAIAVHVHPNTDNSDATVRRTRTPLYTAIQEVAGLPPLTAGARADKPLLEILKGAWVDVWQFEQMVGSTDLQRVRKAVDLYRGPLLEGLLSYGLDWVTHTGLYYDRKCLKALRLLVEQADVCGDYEDALELLEIWRAIDARLYGVDDSDDWEPIQIEVERKLNEAILEGIRKRPVVSFRRKHKPVEPFSEKGQADMESDGQERGKYLELNKAASTAQEDERANQEIFLSTSERVLDRDDVVDYLLKMNDSQLDLVVAWIKAQNSVPANLAPNYKVAALMRWASGDEVKRLAWLYETAQRCAPDLKP